VLSGELLEFTCERQDGTSRFGSVIHPAILGS
jgi:hypothetical protein